MIYHEEKFDSRIIKRGVWKIIHSNEDASINFVYTSTNGEIIETRYIRRTEDTITIYLSSQIGCDQSCRFCHLTASKQTKNTQLNIYDFINQLKYALNCISDKICGATKLKLDFMARGEPLTNPTILYNFKNLYYELEEVALLFNLKPIFNISTIMPMYPIFYLENVFTNNPVRIYYSLYSVNPEFRKRWLPKAMKAEHALSDLQAFRHRCGMYSEVVLHWALIAGENDSQEDIKNTCDTICNYGLGNVRINIVRFNPPNNKYNEGNLEMVPYIFDRIKNPRSKIVQRVGKDCYASCGMFV